MIAWIVLAAAVLSLAGCQSGKDQKALGTEREQATAAPHAKSAAPGAWPAPASAAPIIGHDAGVAPDGGSRHVPAP